MRFHGPAAHGHWLAAICMQWLAAQSLIKGRKKSSIFTYQGHVTLRAKCALPGFIGLPRGPGLRRRDAAIPIARRNRKPKPNEPFG